MMRVGSYQTKDIEKVAEIMGIPKDEVQRLNHSGSFAIEVEAQRGVDARNKSRFEKENEDADEEGEEPAVTKESAATLASFFEDALSVEDSHRLLPSEKSCR